MSPPEEQPPAADEIDWGLDALETHIDAASASRMGKAVEHLVAAACILTTRGELNVASSLVDGEGVDLVFFRRGSTATLAVQVKSRTTRNRMVAMHGRFESSVRESTFAARDDLAMLFVLADVANGRYLTSWLVPSADFAAQAPGGSNGKRRFSASVKTGTQDKWVRYRLGPAELPGAILDRLTTLAGDQVPPA